MRILWLSCAIVIVDQLSKLWVKGFSIPSLGINIRGMHYGQSNPIIGDFFRLTYIENPGMAFGIDVGGKLFFTLSSIVLSLGIFYYVYRARNETIRFRISLGLILGGAIGNLIDRTFYGVIFNEAPLFYGRVVDFFDVDFFDLNILGYSLSRWPVFNVADAAVTVGILMLLLVQHRRAAGAGAEQSLAPLPAEAKTAGEPNAFQTPLPEESSQ